MLSMAGRREGSTPTIIDVARAASVSKTTASDALRGRGRVSEETRLAVESAAERLGYSPNRSARSLRTSVTETIGLHIPEFLTRSEYYMSFVFGVVEQATRDNYNVTLISSGHLPRHGSTPQVDGLVLCDPVAEDEVVRHLAQATVPIVTAERFPGATRPMGVVWSDHGAMVSRLLDHLQGKGARQVALLASGTTSDWSTTLQQTYERWTAEHGMRHLARAAPFGSLPATIREVAREMLADDPDIDAVVCAADGAAATVLPEISAAGRTVGDDLLLASCVDSTVMQVADPPITAIDLDPRRLGAECAALLMEIIAGDAEPDAMRMMPLEMHTRASTKG